MWSFYVFSIPANDTTSLVWNKKEQQDTLTAGTESGSVALTMVSSALAWFSGTLASYTRWVNTGSSSPMSLTSTVTVAVERRGSAAPSCAVTTRRWTYWEAEGGRLSSFCLLAYQWSRVYLILWLLGLTCEFREEKYSGLSFIREQIIQIRKLIFIHPTQRRYSITEKITIHTL